MRLSDPHRHAMKTRPRPLFAALLLGTLMAALTPQICPQDKTPLTATGETREENGKTLAEYKCEKGHTYWVAMD
jgi:hypothetical protein